MDLSNINVNAFDLVTAIIILLLGLKGILNGFFKELFGMIGIVGGIFIASRLGDETGTFLNENLFHFDSQSAVSFTGFLVTLALFWLTMVIIGHLFKKLVSVSGLGPIDRVFGFALGSGKFFLIAAVIAYSFNSIKAVRENIKDMMSDSIMYPVLVEIGEVIVNIDPEDLKEDAKAAMEKASQQAPDAATDVDTQKAEAFINDVKAHIGDAAK